MQTIAMSLSNLFSFNQNFLYTAFCDIVNKSYISIRVMCLSTTSVFIHLIYSGKKIFPMLDVLHNFVHRTDYSIGHM